MRAVNFAMRDPGNAAFPERNDGGWGFSVRRIQRVGPGSCWRTGVGVVAFGQKVDEGSHGGTESAARGEYQICRDVLGAPGREDTAETPVPDRVTDDFLRQECHAEPGRSRRNDRVEVARSQDRVECDGLRCAIGSQKGPVLRCLLVGAEIFELLYVDRIGL